MAPAGRRGLWADQITRNFEATRGLRDGGYKMRNALYLIEDSTETSDYRFYAEHGEKGAYRTPSATIPPPMRGNSARKMMQ